MCAQLMRIQGAPTVKQKTGISKISDVLYFLDRTINHWFTKQHMKFIQFKEINHDTHGRFLANIHAKAKFKRVGDRARRVIYLSPRPMSLRYCKDNEIETAVALKEHYHYKMYPTRREKVAKNKKHSTKQMPLTPYKVTSFFYTIHPKNT